MNHCDDDFPCCTRPDGSCRKEPAAEPDSTTIAYFQHVATGAVCGTCGMDDHTVEDGWRPVTAPPIDSSRPDPDVIEQAARVITAARYNGCPLEHLTDEDQEQVLSEARALAAAGYLPGPVTAEAREKAVILVETEPTGWPMSERRERAEAVVDVVLSSLRIEPEGTASDVFEPMIPRCQHEGCGDTITRGEAPATGWEHMLTAHGVTFDHEAKAPEEHKPAAARLALGEALAMTDRYDGCHERVREWEALPGWEREAHPENYPASDIEDAEWWNRRADSAMAWFKENLTAAGGSYLDVVFDGPPEHVAGRFVEVEDETGHSVNAGEWIDRGNGLWALRIPHRGKAAENEIEGIAQVRVDALRAAADFLDSDRGGNSAGYKLRVLAERIARGEAGA